MRMAKSSMAMMMRAGTRKVRMYSWWGISRGTPSPPSVLDRVVF